MPALVAGIHAFLAAKTWMAGQASLRGLPKVGCEPGHDKQEAARGISSVMPALVTASRVYPICGPLRLPNSDKPEFGCHPRLSSSQAKTWMAGTSPAMTREKP
jgi:hypothetical protein